MAESAERFEYLDFRGKSRTFAEAELDWGQETSGEVPGCQFYDFRDGRRLYIAGILHVDDGSDDGVWLVDTECQMVHHPTRSLGPCDTIQVEPALAAEIVRRTGLDIPAALQSHIREPDTATGRDLIIILGLNPDGPAPGESEIMFLQRFGESYPDRQKAVIRSLSSWGSIPYRDSVRQRTLKVTADDPTAQVVWAVAVRPRHDGPDTLEAYCVISAQDRWIASHWIKPPGARTFVLNLDLTKEIDREEAVKCCWKFGQRPPDSWNDEEPAGGAKGSPDNSAVPERQGAGFEAAAERRDREVLSESGQDRGHVSAITGEPSPDDGSDTDDEQESSLLVGRDANEGVPPAGKRRERPPRLSMERQAKLGDDGFRKVSAAQINKAMGWRRNTNSKSTIERLLAERMVTEPPKPDGSQFWLKGPILAKLDTLDRETNSGAPTGRVTE